MAKTLFVVLIGMIALSALLPAEDITATALDCADTNPGYCKAMSQYCDSTVFSSDVAVKCPGTCNPACQT